MAAERVIAIGTSAGGVEALRTLAGRFPADLPAAVLVVLHIPAHSPSFLHQILNRCGPLPAKQAEDGEEILPGRIYVAANDHHLLVEGDRIRLTRGPKENRVRPAVDALFRSVAASFGSRSIGVVLTGMLDDGTAGLWAIKDRGGITIVQSPAEAEFTSMPDSALEHVEVDYVATLDEMSEIFEKAVRGGFPRANGGDSKRLVLEAEIALEGDALQRGVMQLGAVSPNTCPECHGVLVEIRNGPIIRYRCHTGHAFSLKTLVADVDEAIEAALYGAMRAIEERALLLKRMAAIANDSSDTDAVARYTREANVTAERAQQVKALVHEGPRSPTIASAK